MSVQQSHFQSPQIFNHHFVKPDFKMTQPLVLNLNQSRQSSKALSVDRVKLKQSNDNVEQLVDLWKRHKSITQTTPTNISFQYQSTNQKNESFIIEEIPETREVSPIKDEVIKPKQLFETSKYQTSSHKKTTSLYIGALSKSDAFSGNKKVAKENMKQSNFASNKKNVNSQKKLPKEVSQVVIQLQAVQKSLAPLYTKLDRGKKLEVEEQLNYLINQIKNDFTK